MRTLEKSQGLLHGAIAQLVERYNGIVEVRGSTPLGSTPERLRPSRLGRFLFSPVPTSPHLMDRRDIPAALKQAQEHFETRLQQAVDAYEHWTGGPLEIDLSLVEGEDLPIGDEVLRDKVRSLVDAFHREPIVRETGVRVHKVTAFDSDADGTAAVRVVYDYPA